MNLRRLNKLVKDSGMTKVEIAKKCGITRSTLDNALRGSDIRVSIVESLAEVLSVNVGFLFDNESFSNSAIANGNSSVAAINSEVSVGKDALMEEKIKYLEELLAEKDERIAELKERINELKERK